MDYLWTPWRYQYVSQSAPPGECVFCAAAHASEDRETLIVHRDARNFVILNRFPYTNGHVMVVPVEHVSTLTSLADETLVEIRDDGKGIPSSKLADRNSLGVAGMRERARRIGATLEVEGIEGHGTIVSVRIPVKTAQTASS